MGILDRIRKAGGILKNRLATAVGSLRGVTVSAGRARRGVRFAARATRLTSPVGIGLTAVAFAPEIVKGVRIAGRALGRGVAFFGGRQIATAAGAGGVAGIAGALSTRKSGGVSRPSDFGDPRLQTRLPTEPRRRPSRRRPPIPRQPTAPRRRVARRRVRRKKIRDGRRKRRTHRSPRHKGHKVVSFTTSTGKKVRFLVNPKARHR